MAQLLQVYSGRLELRWKFIKENKKVRTRPRKRSRKQELDQEKKKKLSFFLDHFLGRVLVFFLFFLYKFPPQGVTMRKSCQYKNNYTVQ